MYVRENLCVWDFFFEKSLISVWILKIKYYLCTLIKKKQIMEIVIIQFGMMGVNLISAKSMENQDRNPWFSYFVAGICGGLGISQLLSIFFK